MNCIRRQLRIHGVVQGVGFRPLVYRIAQQQRLTGHVWNDAGGVEVELQGSRTEFQAFLDRLSKELPPGSRVDGIESKGMELVENEIGFSIVASQSSMHSAQLPLAPDRFACGACLQEMNDPKDRRYLYPFVNCTHCGPRFSIARAMPYDRCNTTMAGFKMCPDCFAEYEDPFDRRYHAQPIACPVCGPRVWLVDAAKKSHPVLDHDPISDPARAIRIAAERLKAGDLVAVKGIGGFQLAVDAENLDSVDRLRAFKNRPRKPFALMVADIEEAKSLVRMNQGAQKLLLSPSAPIVVAPKLINCGFLELVAPHLSDVGIMLPTTPLHHLLLERGPKALVMTSANRASEPMIRSNQAALDVLPADAFVLHDRDICTTVDDSVVREVGSGSVFLRRARGYVPDSIDCNQLPKHSVLALGADLKTTVTTLSHGVLLVGRHLGDLANLKTEEEFVSEIHTMLELRQMTPAAVAVDLHPDFTSTRYAEEAYPDTPLYRIQHHHAHFAAVLVEHGVGPYEQAVGIILDGTGVGTDGGNWGGEVLLGGYAGFQRICHLRCVPLPGGDKAGLEPHRMAISLLVDAGIENSSFEAFDDQLASLCASGTVFPSTSSAGRVFDGVAALLGVAPKVQDFEGEAAARLEAVADPDCHDAYPLPQKGQELDVRDLIGSMLEDQAGLGIRAARFHNGLADGLARAALNSKEGLFALGGGCMVNARLTKRLVSKLSGKGARVLLPKYLPPGDGGLSAGQAACAACLVEKNQCA